jgi:hypothetical protein
VFGVAGDMPTSLSNLYVFQGKVSLQLIW